MKNNFFKKNHFRIFPLIAITLLLASCSKKGDSNVTPPSKASHKVYFKATVSAGSSINNAAYGYDATQTSATSLSGTTWTSPELTAPGGTVEAVCSVGATGANASSTLTVQIFVDGTMVKQGTASGQILGANVTYSF